jgi:pimeloyl-ACP methyl ester carboxylesterase
MPIASTGSIDIHYEVHGRGEPLLMIQGLGHSSRFWFLQLPVLQQHFRTVVYDCRGVGHSSKPEEPYTLADDAADALAVLDALGIDRTHVVGLSRGGYIAQALAIDHPQRVNRLALMATHYGGPAYLEATSELWREILDIEGLSRDQIFRRGIEYTTTPEFFSSHQEMVERVVALRMEQPQPAFSFKLQFDSAVAHEARERVGRIRAPTLVVAGAQDRVVPLEFVEKLYRAIPGARLAVVEDAGHLLFLEQPDVVSRLLVEFLG